MIGLITANDRALLDNSGWVIQRCDRYPSKTWWYGNHDSPFVEWTDDPNYAIRFARQIDARSFIECKFKNEHVSWHEFISIKKG